jgi:hypothetical protein
LLTLLIMAKTPDIRAQFAFNAYGRKWIDFPNQRCI